MATNTYAALDTQVLGTAASSVTFSSIPSGYTDLRIVINTATSVNAYPFIQFNGDTGSNYSLTELLGNGSSASSSRGSNMTHIQTFNVNTTTSIDTMMSWDIMNYSNSTTYKTVLSRANAAGNGTNAIVGLWRNTAAITSITIGCINSGVARTFSAGSTFTIYGIAAVPQLTAKATGGTIYYGADGYVYHKFTGNGTFTPTSALSADVLVVAGGGSGYCGGGGAGGLLGFTAQSLTTTGYTVTVGAGGSGGVNTSSAGSNSVFGALTAAVGGGRGGYNDIFITTFSAGGSGGGGGGSGSGTTVGGTATSGQGYSGGGNGGFTGSPYGGGGGGGAAEAGQNATAASAPGRGGNGTNAYSQWAAATSSGVSGYFAGGGGSAGTDGSGANGAGGLGGGAAATAGADNPGAVANTGGGGGGVNSGTYRTGNGGSGIVIVRYLG